MRINYHGGFIIVGAYYNQSGGTELLSIGSSLLSRVLSQLKPSGFSTSAFWGWLTKPRIATNGAHDPNEKIPEPYRYTYTKYEIYTNLYALFYIFSTNKPFVAVRGWKYVLADRHPNRCRTLRKYSHIITYHCLIIALVIIFNLCRRINVFFSPHFFIIMIIVPCCWRRPCCVHTHHM